MFHYIKNLWRSCWIIICLLNRMRRKTRKNLKGGNKNLRFRYTKNSSRIKWTETLYPYGLQLMKEISKIPWNTYKFEGINPIVFMEDPDNLDKVTELLELSGTAILPEPAYIILGGSACELLDHKYHKKIKLSDYVDPTSDIDIVLSMPIFKPIDNPHPKDVYRTVLYNEGYTNLSEHYSRWLFDEVVKLMKHFKENVKLPKLAETTKENTIETEISDLNESVGPFLISRLHYEDMIKIQVTTTINNYSEHLLEFILGGAKYPPPNNNECEKETPKKKDFFIVNDIYVRKPNTLLFGQLRALINRQKNYEKSNEKHLDYKVYNHCGRILYLAKLIKALHSEKIETHVIIPSLFSEIKKNLNTLKSGFCDTIHKDFYKTFIESFKDFPNYNIYVKQLKLLD